MSSSISGFSQKQLQVLQFGYQGYDGLICDGTIRSGKTSVMTIAFILWAMTSFKNKTFIIASKSVTSAERNIIKPLMDILYLHKQFDIAYYRATNTLKVTRGNNTQYFYVFGGKDEASYQTVQGVTAAGAFLDEVVLMPQSFVNQVLARCSVPNSKFWFSCNPEGPDHWFYKEWIQKHQEKNCQYLHFTMNDNPSLDAKIIARYEGMYEGVFYQRYILGQWVQAEGIIYEKFASNMDRYLLDTVPADLMLVNVGVDFGGNKSATAFVATGFTPMLSQVIVLDAVRITAKLSPEQLDAEFVAFATDIYAKYGKPFNSRCDNAEPVLIRGLKNAALQKRLRTSVKLALKKPINDRIELVARLLGQDRLKMMRNTTKPLQNGLRTAVWNEKLEGKRLDDGTSDIDILDAFEYSIEEYMDNLLDTM
jgi:PBSX family phage terminase large subunit